MTLSATDTQAAAAAAAAGRGFSHNIPAEQASVSSRQTAQTMDSAGTATTSTSSSNRRGGGWFAQFKTMLGIDAFVATATDELSAVEQGQQGRAAAPVAVPPRFPYSKGCARNCEEFWCDGANDGVLPLRAYFRMARPPAPGRYDDDNAAGNGSGRGVSYV